jgi:hypothetical protein
MQYSSKHAMDEFPHTITTTRHLSFRYYFILILAEGFLQSPLTAGWSDPCTGRGSA